MRATRVGQLLVSLGLLVGLAAGLGLVFGFEPARLPPALLNIAAYKLTFVGALGLLAAGAVVQRYARREAMRDAALRSPSPAAKGLMEGQSALGDEIQHPRPKAHQPNESKGRGG